MVTKKKQTHPKHLEKILDKLELNKMFMEMGADLQCLDQVVRPSYEILQSTHVANGLTVTH